MRYILKIDIVSIENSHENYSGIILPGVGSFKKGIDYLKNSGLFETNSNLNLFFLRISNVFKVCGNNLDFFTHSFL